MVEALLGMLLRRDLQGNTDLVMGLAIAVALILVVGYIVHMTDQREIEGPAGSRPASQ